MFVWNTTTANISKIIKTIGDTMKVSAIAELKKIIGKIISDTPDNELPKEIIFNRGIDYSKYKITIETIEEDFFIDAKGVKWKKITSDKD